MKLIALFCLAAYVVTLEAAVPSCGNPGTKLPYCGYVVNNKKQNMCTNFYNKCMFNSWNWERTQQKMVPYKECKQACCDNARIPVKQMGVCDCKL